MNKWHKFLRLIAGESIWEVSERIRTGKSLKAYCFDPVSLVIASVVAAGATAAYSANREASAAKKAAAMQAETAQKQMDAVKEQETMAQETAQKKLQAARARQTQTILTAPSLEEANINTKSTLGV